MKFVNILVKISAVCALALTILNVNTTCIGFGHQPKVPQAAQKFKKS